MRCALLTGVQTCARPILKGAFPAAGFEIKDRDRAAPGTSRFFERMGQFLSLLGLAALPIAGIGVSNGITSYLAIQRDGIATLQLLGPSTTDITRIYLVQVCAVAAHSTACVRVLAVRIPVALVYAR